MNNFNVNTFMLLLIAAINLVTLIVGRMTQSRITTLEKNTNSIKDALVAATARASLAEGTAVGLQQGRDEPRP